MATIIKRPSGNWKAIIRKAGWPLKAKTFRTKRDAEDWARRTEDEMVRGVHITLGKRMQTELGDEQGDRIAVSRPHGVRTGFMEKAFPGYSFL